MGTMDPRESARGPKKETKAVYEHVAHLFLHIVFSDGLPGYSGCASRRLPARSHQCEFGLRRCGMDGLSWPDGGVESRIVASKPRRVSPFEHTGADAEHWVDIKE